MFRRLLDGITGANHREVQTHPKLDPDTNFLAEAACDANVCALTPSLFPPHGGCPGSLLPLGPPHPTRSTHHRISIALTSGRISVHASTSDNNHSRDGVVSWRLLSSRAYNSLSRSNRKRSSHRRRVRPEQVSSHSYRSTPSVRLSSPPLLSRTNSFDQKSQPLLSLAEAPKRWTVVQFTNDFQAKVELRNQASQQVLHINAEESKFGSMSFSYTPRKRLSASIEGRQSWLGLSRTQFFPSPPKMISNCLRSQVRSYAEALMISPDGFVVSVPFPVDDEQQSSPSQSTQATNSTSPPLCMRVNAEYGLKERRWTVNTGVEGERRELSAKLLTRPLRVMPRFQVPVSGSRNRSWVRWTHGEQSFMGEMEFGWRNFTLAHVWCEKSLRLCRTFRNGSRFTLFLSDKGVAKVDSTLIFKVLKGRLSLTANTTMASKKHLCCTSLALNHSLGSLSAYAKPDRSYGLALESNFTAHAQSYHVALKMENFESISFRLGLFY